MRRHDRELSESESKELLARGEYGILCTCGQDGMPYGVPVNYVYDGVCIGFHSALEGHKVQNLCENSRVCFTVVGATRVLPGKFSTLYESAVAFGKVVTVEGERKLSILRSLVEKYSSDFCAAGEMYIAAACEQVSVYEMQIGRLSGKAHR